MQPDVLSKMDTVIRRKPAGITIPETDMRYFIGCISERIIVGFTQVLISAVWDYVKYHIKKQRPSLGGDPDA